MGVYALVDAAFIRRRAAASFSHVDAHCPPGFEQIEPGQLVRSVELGLRALACVPLEEGGRVFGVLYLDGKREAPAFSGLDVEILETLAERAAILLAGARLHVELRVLAGEAALAELAG